MNIREELKAYIDGELDRERAAEVEKAIESDPRLAAEAESLKSLGNAVREITPMPAPQGVESTIAAVSRRPGISFRSLPSSLAAGVVGVVATITVASLVLSHRSSSGSEEAAAPVASADSAAPATTIVNGSTSRKTALSDSVSGAIAETQSSETAAPAKPASQEEHDGHPAKPVQKQSSEGLALEPKVAHTAAIRIAVASLSNAEEQAARTVTNVQGRIAGNRSRNSRGKAITVTYKVPAEEFDRVMRSLQQLGDSKLVKSTAEDVTTEMGGIEAKLRANFAQKREIVQKEEERLKYLSERASVATITITFVPKGVKNSR